jgi:hypothetical protein
VPTEAKDAAMNPLAHRLVIVLWPAFVVAGLIEMVVFAFVEPSALHTLDGSALDLSATAVYSIAFFVFWALVASACLVVLRLASSAEEINAPWR